jgi:hypothetical protein
MLAKYAGFFPAHLFSLGCAFCVCLSSAPTVSADQDTASCSRTTDGDALQLREIRCMTDDELQTFRGGFVQNNQIIIGFGFERIVRVDGEIQEHILAGLPSLNLPNNIQLVPINRSIGEDSSKYILENSGGSSVFSEAGTGTQGSMSALSPQLQVVPSTSALQDIMSNVIQNTLDDRVIDQIRVINIDLMGLGASPAFNPQTDLNPAIFESLGF